jgi:hypothetical protein
MKSAEEKWSKDDLEQHIKVNVKDYGAAIVVAALFKKLYGKLPKIGLSGYQAEIADKVSDKIITQERERAAILVKALEFYAEKDNESIFEIGRFGISPDVNCTIHEDVCGEIKPIGERARQALKEWRGE